MPGMWWWQTKKIRNLQSWLLRGICCVIVCLSVYLYCISGRHKTDFTAYLHFAIKLHHNYGDEG